MKTVSYLSILGIEMTYNEPSRFEPKLNMTTRWKIIGSYEPRREKTGLRGFRPGLTQTGLYSHRSRLEA